MSLTPEAKRWLNSRVVAHTIRRGGPKHSEGRVLSYSDRPQVLIETEDGERLWWVADLCEIVDDSGHRERSNR